MKSRCATAVIVLALLAIPQLTQAQELVQNGDFSQELTGWPDLVVAGSAAATCAVTNGVCKIDLTAPGTEAWHVQLRQSGIPLVHGNVYTMSFDAYASGDRTIMAFVGMENGPYTPYSDTNLATYSLTGTKKTFATTFSMNAASDANARVQFNCGLSDVDVYLDNVSIVEEIGPVLQLLSPRGGEVFPAGASREISWLAANIPGRVAIEYSTDAGATWTSIAEVEAAAGAYRWTVPSTPSAACEVRVRTSDGTAVATSAGMFTIAASTAYLPGELIVNGDFLEAGAGWDALGVYGGAQAAAAFPEANCLVTVGSPGSEAWHVQFTQARIPLVKDAAYQFQFDASASQDRTIEANLGMNGGAYTTYAASGPVSLSTTKTTFSKIFVMHHASDSSARVEFNCGKYAGNVTIDNVSLRRLAGPLIKLIAPDGGDLVSMGMPYDIAWLAIGVTGTIAIEYSADNGAMWRAIAQGIENTGTYRWNVPAEPSPWCLVRISASADTGLTDVSDRPFEIAPPGDLIVNGSFDDGTTGWDPLGVNAGSATGSVENGAYNIDIAQAGTLPWHTQLTQTGIALVKGATYILSFDAYAAGEREINVNVGMSSDPYSSYLDSSVGTVSLTGATHRFTIEFVMQGSTDMDARVEFNCGTSDIGVFIDNVSLRLKPGSMDARRRVATPQAGRALPIVIGGARVGVCRVPDASTLRAVLLSPAGRVVGRLAVVDGRIVLDDRREALAKGLHIVRLVGKGWMTHETVVIP